MIIVAKSHPFFPTSLLTFAHAKIVSLACMALQCIAKNVMQFVQKPTFPFVIGWGGLGKKHTWEGIKDRTVKEREKRKRKRKESKYKENIYCAFGTLNF